VNLGDRSCWGGPPRPGLAAARRRSRSTSTPPSARPTACSRRAAPASPTPRSAGTIRCSPPSQAPATWCTRGSVAAPQTVGVAPVTSWPSASPGCAMRAPRADHGARLFRLLQPQGGPGLPPGRDPLLHHGPAQLQAPAPSSRPSPSKRRHRSHTGSMAPPMSPKTSYRPFGRNSGRRRRLAFRTASMDPRGWACMHRDAGDWLSHWWIRANLSVGQH
jgi:hypothetical protein